MSIYFDFIKEQKYIFAVFSTLFIKSPKISQYIEKQKNKTFF